MSKINHSDRYLVRRNKDRRIVASTNDLGIPLPAGFSLIDTIGEDGLGGGIPSFLTRKDRHG